jgi:hypothetical protein
VGFGECPWCHPHCVWHAVCSRRLLKWSFGKGVRKADLRTGYTTTVRNARILFWPGGAGVRLSSEALQVIPDTDGTFIEWKQSGRSCTGTYRPDVSVAVLSFYLPGSTVTVTYRPVDANSTQKLFPVRYYYL